MATIYLEVFSLKTNCRAPIETIIVLFILKVCKTKNVKTVFVYTDREKEINGCSVDISILNEFSYEALPNINDLPDAAKNCKLPSLAINSSNIIAGLCACLRQIIKLAKCDDPLLVDILGFKESCLQACSESSVWTRYCEVDLISTLNRIQDLTVVAELPIDLVRFEVHLSQPVRFFNISKYSKTKAAIRNSFEMSELRKTIEELKYAEGLHITLADLIIFICIHTFMYYYSKDDVFKLLPLTAKWYKRVASDNLIKSHLKLLSPAFYDERLICEPKLYRLPAIPNESLYKSDQKNSKSRDKVYTKQEDIENSLMIVENMKLKLIDEPWEDKSDLNWSKLPFNVTPEGGSVPSTRATRKRHQLKSLCKPILKLAKKGDTIVDFCSGGGHLGILVAYLLPECTVILLENKEKSINFAKERVKKLKLINIKFYQCNLDYFIGNFDIGTSLHACGVATDLVIRQCILRNANFVSCPCCYGSIQNCHHITYPRSKIYKKQMNNREYLTLGHAADQTHDEENIKTKQGYECMNIIDTDRKLYAEQFGYKVHLIKLTPENCTPKNNLLIGLSSKR